MKLNHISKLAQCMTVLDQTGKYKAQNSSHLLSGDDVSGKSNRNFATVMEDLVARDTMLVAFATVFIPVSSPEVLSTDS